MQAGRVTLAPENVGMPIDLGGVDILNGTLRTLGLSDAELVRIIAGTLNIGRVDSGSLVVSRPLAQNTKASRNKTRLLE